MISTESELCSAFRQVSRQRERKLRDLLDTKNSVAEGNQSQIFRTVLIIAHLGNELAIVTLFQIFTNNTNIMQLSNILMITNRY